MGIACKTYSSCDYVFKCAHCDAHLAGDKDFVSDGFLGETGKAFLFNTALNVHKQQRRTASMTSGMFVVQYLNCRYCNSYLGWHYVQAMSDSERYKEGKCVLELKMLARSAGLSPLASSDEEELCDEY